MSDEMKLNNHIVQYPKEYSACLGCMSCEMLCSLIHDGKTGLNRGCITVQRNDKTLLHHILVCEQCADHPCYEACPKKGKAMVVGDDGIVTVNPDECVGCGLCARACRYEPSRIKIVDGKARKCDLCKDREGGPVCIANCNAVCIGLSDSPLPYEGTLEEVKKSE